MINWPKANIAISIPGGMMFRDNIHDIKSQRSIFGLDFFETEKGEIVEYNTGFKISEKGWEDAIWRIEYHGEEIIRKLVVDNLKTHGFVNDLNDAFTKDEIKEYNLCANKHYERLDAERAK